MTVVPPPSPIYDLIAIELALAVLILWLAITFERRFHRLPIITGAVLLLITFLGLEQVWRPLAALARMLHALLEHIGLLGLLALILLPLSLVLAYPTLRRWLRRGGRLP